MAQWLSSKIYIYIYIRMERKWHSMLKGAFNIDNRQSIKMENQKNKIK